MAKIQALVSYRGKDYDWRKRAPQISMWKLSLAHGRNTCASDQVGNDARLIREARQSIVRASPSDVHCASIQLSDPVSLTATFVNVCVRGAPSAVPLCSVENSSGPAFL